MDVIILGCTHFLNITDIFEEACGKDIKVVDSIDGVVRHSLDVRGLQEESGAEISKKTFTPQLYTTGFTDDLEKAQYNTLCKKFKIQFMGLLS